MLTPSGREWPIIRRRDAELRRLLARRPRPRSGGEAAYVGRVCDGGDIPTAVPAIFLTRPVAISTGEAEGDTPTISQGDCEVPVLVLGPAVPAVGDEIVARLVQGVWVAQTGGEPPEPTYPCSPCDIPQTDLVLSLTYYKCIAGTPTLTALGPIPLVLVEKPFAGQAERNGAPESFEFDRYWKAGCVLFPDSTITASCPGTERRFYFVFGCNKLVSSGVVRLVAKSYADPFYTEAQCIDGIDDSGATDTFLDDFTTFTNVATVGSCSPLDLSYQFLTNLTTRPIIGTVTE